MSIKLMAEVWDEAPVKGGALLFLLALADQAGDSDRCAWPGVQQLQRRARCSERSAYDYAAELQELGIITRLEGDDRPSRYSRAKGRETTCWRINPASEWRGATSAPLRESVTDPCGGSQGTPAVARSRTTTTPQKRTPKKNSRALRGVQDSDEGLARTGGLPDEGVAEAPAPRKKPLSWSTRSLVEEFAFLALAADTMPPSTRSTNRAALGTNFKKWQREGTATPDEIHAAMETFFGPGLGQRVLGHTSLWLAFINSYSTLATRTRTTTDYDSEPPVNDLVAAFGLQQ